jgi:hypothetical protein
VTRLPVSVVIEERRDFHSAGWIKSATLVGEADGMISAEAHEFQAHHHFVSGKETLI